MTILPFASEAEVGEAVPLARSHLDLGGLLAYPTETVYGLGSRPVEADLRRLAELKGREPGKPFLLLVSGRAMAEDFGLQFTKAASDLADAFWPGPLTLVLARRGDRLPRVLEGNNGGIAVRWTSHVGMAALIAVLQYPMPSTSANRPGLPAATGALTIAEMFPSPDLLILDGGLLGSVQPSTLVDCTRAEPSLVREGALSRDDLWGRVESGAP